ncbi:MAG: hypothetical protein J6E42_07190 [Firmicutes bacterium]|nr:hypothetical protein [Bacillota bacterium]
MSISTFLSFTVFVSTIFFLGIYMDLLRLVWLSLLIAGGFVWLILLLSRRFFPRVIRVAAGPAGVRRLLSIVVICYGGLVLYAFFRFCQDCIFPDHPFYFFPVCFLLLTAYGTRRGLDTLQRTARIASVTVAVLLVLTVVSTLQKLWAQRQFVVSSFAALTAFDMPGFALQTVLIAAVLLAQTLTLLLTADPSDDASSQLRSLSRGLIRGIGASSLLYLLAVLALGSYSFERLTYPIYDMLSLPGVAEYLDRTEFLMLILFLFCESTKTISIFAALGRAWSSR